MKVLYGCSCPKRASSHVSCAIEAIKLLFIYPLQNLRLINRNKCPVENNKREKLTFGLLRLTDSEYKLRLIRLVSQIRQVGIPYLNAPSKAKKSACNRSSNRASASNAVVLPIAESLLRLNLCFN